MTELRDLTPHAAIPAEQAGRDARQRRQLRANLPELVTLERLLAEAPESATVSVAERVSTDGLTLPVYQVTLGAAEPSAPLVLLVGGVHGLERIGTQVVTAWLSMVLHRMRWDRALQHLLGQVRVVVLPLPLLNPGGMYRNQRSNPNGVDLMRNAPIRAQSGSTFMLGGQRWVRKRPGQLLRLDGLFNPLVPHRTRRALRSHLNWIDFLLHAAASHDQWLPGQDQEPLLRQAALQLWYRDNA